MGLWDDLFRKHGHNKSKEIQELLEIIKFQAETELTLSKEILTLQKNCAPRFIAFFSTQSFNKKSKLLIQMLTLQIGQPGDVIGIEIYDSITGNVLDKAVASGQTYSVDDATIVSAAPDADPTKEDVEPLAAGTTNIEGSVTADLTAYGLGAAVVLSIPPAPITVIPAAVQVTPAARLVVTSQATGAPVTP